MSAAPAIQLAHDDPTAWLGRRSGIPIDQYHRATPGISKSNLDDAHRSIAHYLAGLGAERKATPAMAFGEAFHARVLEPERFESAFAVSPECDLRTKDGRERMTAWRAEHQGAIGIAAEWATSIDSMYDAVVSHPIAGRLFEGGDAEHSFWWRDRETGLTCKCRPDYLRPDAIAVDLKTAADASPEGFTRAVFNYRYHVQQAFYSDGIASVLGVPLGGFLFVAVEKDPPYAVAVYNLDDFASQRGRLDYQDDLARIKAHCDNPGVFTGYSPTIEEIRLPRWAE